MSSSPDEIEDSSQDASGNSISMSPPFARTEAPPPPPPPPPPPCAASAPAPPPVAVGQKRKPEQASLGSYFAVQRPRLAESYGFKLKVALLPNGITDVTGDTDNPGVREMILRPSGFSFVRGLSKPTWRHDASNPPPHCPRDPIDELTRRCETDGVHVEVEDRGGKPLKKVSLKAQMAQFGMPRTLPQTLPRQSAAGPASFGGVDLLPDDALASIPMPPPSASSSPARPAQLLSTSTPVKDSAVQPPTPVAGNSSWDDLFVDDDALVACVDAVSKPAAR